MSFLQQQDIRYVVSIYLFCIVHRHINNILTVLFITLYWNGHLHAQNQPTKYRVPSCIYQGDTIPAIQLKPFYVFQPVEFKNNRQRRAYDKLVRNVKKVYPISLEIRQAVIETYEYLQTLPDEKARQKHIKRVEKGLKEQYTARMKKLTYSQGKLLIKLVDRASHQTSYELVKAFMGPLKAGFYQAFAALFGASLKKEYDPEGEDREVEQIILMIESGQL